MIFLVFLPKHRVEFKRLAEGKVAVKTVEIIVALANTEGGVIILGVDDPEKTKLKGVDRIFGIDENIDVFDALGREIQRIVPPLSGIWPPRIIEAENKKRFGMLFVPKAALNFYSINNHVYVRAEKGNRQLNAHEIVNFSYAKGFQKADGLLVNVDFDLLNTDVFKEWKQTRSLRGDSLSNILEKIGLARKDENQILKPTLAAVLLFAEYPSDLTEYKCAIRVFQYSGTIETIRETPNLLGIPKTIQGPLIKMIKDAHEYVLTLLRSGIQVPSGFKNIYRIPERTVKEAITNAVIHRDYYKKRDITVKIFEDRVEIESPGLFPYNITRNNIGFVRAEGYRNDLLVKHLREFPFPPNLDENEGVRAMREEMNSQNLYPPLFLSYPLFQDAVKVILLNEHRPSEWKKISSYLQENKFISNEKAREVTGIKQRDKMSYMLRRWVDQGLLIQLVPPSGFIKGTKYKLSVGSDMKETD
jgi:ATP-dependent DNA helicase RecG